MDNFFSKAYADTLYVGAGYVDDEINALAIQIAAAYQPLDADLTALAALAGTNTIYYRSGANTWSAVTIGSNLTFSGGTLAATGGGGGGGGDALTTNPLSQFASTTSAQLAGVISDETGSGSLVFATSPTLVTPLLGTPTSGTLTNCTGLPISTGVSGLGTGVATFLATPSSANLASAITNETGTAGSLVFSASPTFTGTAAFAAITATGDITASGNISLGPVAGLNSVLSLNHASGTSGIVGAKVSGYQYLGFGFNDVGPYGTGGGGTVPNRGFFVYDYDGGSYRFGIGPTGTVFLGSSTSSTRVDSSGNITGAGWIDVKHRSYTFAGLPTAASSQDKTFVCTDSTIAMNGTNYGTTPAGGGANRVKVFSNGTNWLLA